MAEEKKEYVLQKKGTKVSNGEELTLPLFKLPQKSCKVRMIEGVTLQKVYKHLGKGKDPKKELTEEEKEQLKKEKYEALKSGKELENRFTKNLFLYNASGKPYRPGCDLYLDPTKRQPQAMYDRRDLDGNIIEKCELTLDEVINIHPLLFTTCCSDQNATDTSTSECLWCKKVMNPGIKTLKRQKFLTGFLVDENNNLFVVDLNKSKLAETMMDIKKDDTSDIAYDHIWIDIIKDPKPKNGFPPAWIAVKSKKEIVNVNELNEEMLNKYQITFDDLSLKKGKDIFNLLKVYIPEVK